MPVLQQRLMGGTAQRLDAALLLAGVESTPGLRNPREATLPGRVLVKWGGHPTTLGGDPGGRTVGDAQAPAKVKFSKCAAFVHQRASHFREGIAFATFSA